jgi:mannose-6-phosphate isomerase
MLYPLTFQPIFKDRVWGGRQLEQLYKKNLPPGVPIGESWEISDRPGDVSVIANGPHAGKDLRWLMENRSDELLGAARAPGDRFPLLVKILDAQDKLSLQVHPPAEIAPKLGGEPKTEMWYFTRAEPWSEVYAGLKHGVTRAEFEQKLSAGTVADCFHRVPVRQGDALFLPSGRVHALGAGLVLFEIQQNSDTTYRVFDWNRTGLDGKPRALHVPEALASIDFADFEPGLIGTSIVHGPNYTTRLLINDPLFKTNEIILRARDYILPRIPRPQIIGLISGQVTVSDGQNSVELTPGRFCLIPASVRTAKISAAWQSNFLLISPG